MIYFLTILINLLFIFLYDKFKVKNSKIAYNFLLIAFILIAGLRWKVGGDTLVYQNKFENNIVTIFNLNYENIWDSGFEPGIVILMSLCKTIFNEFWFFQFVHATIVNVILFKFFKKYTVYKFTAVFVYSFFYFFYFNTEILREVLAICIFIYMYPLLENKKYKKYYLLNIIALFFHTSAIILLIIPIFSKIKFNKKGIYYLTGLFVILSLMFTIFPNVTRLFLFTDRLAAKYDVYVDYSFSLIGMIYNFIMFAFLPYIVISFNRKNGKINQFENLFFSYFLIISVYLSFSGAGRFINYFGPFMLVYYVNTFYNLSNSKKYKSLTPILGSILLIIPFGYKSIYYSFSYDKHIKGAKKIHMYYPYTDIVTKDDKIVSQRIKLAQILMSSEK